MIRKKRRPEELLSVKGGIISSDDTVGSRPLQPRSDAGTGLICGVISMECRLLCECVGGNEYFSADVHLNLDEAPISEFLRYYHKETQPGAIDSTIKRRK